MGMLKFCVASTLLMVSTLGYTADCRHRGDLDTPFCDADNDFVADPPKEISGFKNPETLVFSGTPEDSALYQTLLQPFIQHLEQCTNKKVTFRQVSSNPEEIELMRSGQIHIGSFSTGPTGYAVNMAGAVPFAVHGKANKFRGYNMLLIVRKDHKAKKISDLKGGLIAHSSASSNSGNLAPRALLPKQGLAPDKDYTVFYSGRHDSSVIAVKEGKVDAAAVASDVFYRMAARGEIKEDEFRTIYASPWFPTESVVHAHDLEPKLRDKIKKCFYDYRFTVDMQNKFDGSDRFFPVTYKKDWDVVRLVALTAGQGYDRAAYEKELKREEEKKRKGGK